MKGYTVKPKDLYFTVDGHTTAPGATPAFLWQVPDEAMAAIDGVVYTLPREDSPVLFVRKGHVAISTDYKIEDVTQADLAIGGSLMLVDHGEVMDEIKRLKTHRPRTVLGILPSLDLVFFYTNSTAKGAAMLARSLGCIEAMQLVSPPQDQAKAAVGALTARALPAQVIVLDPAHGGDDPGAVGTGLWESKLNLGLAEHIAACLKKYDALTLMTRVGDESVKPDDRALLTNAAEADALVSLHHSNDFRGYADTVSTNPSSGCLRLQAGIRRRVSPVLRDYKIIDRGSRQSDSQLLRSVNCASVTLDWLSVRADTSLLADVSIRQIYCDAVASGIADSLGLQKLVLGRPASETLYRVQVGLFHTRQEAEALKAKLESLGLEVFLAG